MHALLQPVRLFTAALLLAPVATGAQVAPAQPTPADVRQYARLLAQTDARKLEAPFLDSTLTASWRPLRAAATLAIGQAGERAFAPRLRALVMDADTTVAANAAFALGLLRDTVGVTALVDAVGRSSAPGVALEAAWALGEIGEPARGAIATALGAPATARDARVVRSLLQSASRLRPVPVDVVVPFLASGDSVVREAAAYAIARTRAPMGVRPLLALAGASDAGTRGHVARVAARSGAGDTLTDLALPALGQLASDADPHVRIQALRSFGTYGSRGTDAVLAGITDVDANVRIEAAQQLAGVLPADTAAWTRAWRADTGFMYRRSVLASAARSGVVLPAVSGWTSSADWLERAAVAEAAAGAPRFTLVEGVMRDLADDPDARVRTAAIGALARWADSTDHPEARRVVLAAAEDRDTTVRAIALAALGDRAGAAALRSERAQAPRPLSWYEDLVRRYVLSGARGAVTADLVTERGTVTIALHGADAPMTVHNLVTLAESGYYRDLRFHRVVPAFVAQVGDPRGDGGGGPGYAIRDELNRHRYARGAVGMALSGPDTGGSQFFLTLSPQPHLDGHYTVFGRVIAGQAVADALVQGDRLVDIRVR